MDCGRCETCGHLMHLWRPTQRWCSKECRGASERRANTQPVDKWCDLYGQGISYQKIADRYGVSYQLVRRRVQRAGVPARSDHEHFEKYREANTARLKAQWKAIREKNQRLS